MAHHVETRAAVAQKSNTPAFELPERPTTAALANWCKVDPQWFGYGSKRRGPPAHYDGPRGVFFRYAEVVGWLGGVVVRIPPSNIRHHLDRTALRLLEIGADYHPQELFKTEELAKWLGISTMWLEIGRSTGKYGPAYCKLAEKTVRYRVKEVREWLEARAMVAFSSCGEK